MLTFVLGDLQTCAIPFWVAIEVKFHENTKFYQNFFIFMYLTHGFWLNSTIFCHFHDIFSGFWGEKRSRNKKLDALELFFFHVCLSGTYIESLAKVQLLTSKFDFWLSTALTRALFRAFWGILPYRSIFQGSSWDHMYDIRLAFFFLCTVLSCYGAYVSVCVYLLFLQTYRTAFFGDFSPKSMHKVTENSQNTVEFSENPCVKYMKIKKCW